MLELIGGGLSSLSAALDIAKGLNGTINEARIAEVKLDLIGRIMDAKEALLAAQEEKLATRDRISALEAEIAKLKDWSAEAERYELANTGQGGLAYREKGTVPSGQDGDWLCPNCFQNGKKSHLLPETLTAGRTHYLRCHPCGMEILTRGTRDNAIHARRGR